MQLAGVALGVSAWGILPGRKEKKRFLEIFCDFPICG
jgi:hypothetical protein